ncbi:WxL protein peptidoglycan domain-containing protein [Streptomyces sp. NPDC060027]|uniref:WxL protein peptidoglycan domain-containing protein n=1 Tax=Streptomyces sp. NPDC060027 TaxID=3347040 RepID=UPI0036B3FC46
MPIRSRGTPGAIRPAVSCVLLVLLLTLLVSPVPAAAAGSGPSAWSVRPAGAVTDGVRRGVFSLDAAPGSKIKDAVLISNLSKVPLSFQVYGTDAYNTPRDGALAYREAGQAQQGIGRWVKLRTNALVIPAGRSAEIPFTVTVPPDATPGAHVGGIVALNNAVEQAGQDNGVDLGIQRAIAVRMQLAVAGPLTPGVTVRGVRLTHRPAGVPFRSGRATVRYTVVNTGNTVVQPTARPRATGLFGRTLKTFRTARLPVLLPGRSTVITAAWDDAPPLDFVHASVRVSAQGVPEASAESGSLLLSWTTLAVLLAALALPVLALSQVRRRRRARLENTP